MKFIMLGSVVTLLTMSIARAEEAPRCASGWAVAQFAACENQEKPVIEPAAPNACPGEKCVVSTRKECADPSHGVNSSAEAWVDANQMKTISTGWVDSKDEARQVEACAAAIARENANTAATGIRVSYVGLDKAGEKFANIFMDGAIRGKYDYKCISKVERKPYIVKRSAACEPETYGVITGYQKERRKACKKIDFATRLEVAADVDVMALVAEAKIESAAIAKVRCLSCEEHLPKATGLETAECLGQNVRAFVFNETVEMNVASESDKIAMARQACRALNRYKGQMAVEIENQLIRLTNDAQIKSKVDCAQLP